MFPKRALKCCCHEVDRLAMCQGLNRKSAFTAFIPTHSHAEEKRQFQRQTDNFIDNIKKGHVNFIDHFKGKMKTQKYSNLS